MVEVWHNRSMLPLFIELQHKRSSQGPTYVTEAGGLGVSFIACNLAEQKPVVLVAKDPDQAEEFLQDVRFLLGDKASQALFLPAHERTPFEATSPDPLVVMERLATLFKIASGETFRVLVTSPEAFIQKTVSADYLLGTARTIKRHGQVERDELLSHLELVGYSKVTTVEDPGTYAVRGSIIDIFWPGAVNPVRIDLFGDEVEHLKSFDAKTQRTVKNLTEFTFGPVREFVLTKATSDLAHERLRDLADEIEYPTKKLKEKLHDIDNGIPFFGIEHVLQALHPILETPLNILNQAHAKDSLYFVVNDEDAFKQQVANVWQTFDNNYNDALIRGELCFSPAIHLATIEDAYKELNEQPVVFVNGLLVGEKAESFKCKPTSSIRQDILKESTRTDDAGEKNQHHLFAPVVGFIKQRKQDQNVVLLPVSSHGGMHQLEELLTPHGISIQRLQSPPNLFQQDFTSFRKPSVHAYTFVATPHAPTQGAIFSELGLTIICEDDIFGKRVRRGGQTGKQGGFKTTLLDINPGDYVVHIDHGIGIFRGLTKLNVRGANQDYILITYSDDDKLYLPVHRIRLIQKYSGVEGQNVRLDKLGGPGWQTKKSKVKQAVLAMAQDLLNLYAKRELATRTVYAKLTEAYFEFEAGFAFDTTPDQQKAIDEIIKDMQSAKPMDRLVCGDVGYGKTEVAMRAAMLCVLGGGQVAVLSPTTVLAQQHGITFSERFKNTGVNIAVISRFQSHSEVKETLQKAKEGKIDILIGTHRILSSDVSFRNLSLVIVDEEQRFGIKAKEHLKKMRTYSDILTLTATPIPRTLQMGFFGLRDLSVIETPPVDRRAIRTTITRFDDAVIKEAILREVSRGGQIYFVHNRVSSIHAMGDYLKQLVPDVKVEIGHGQMPESELEDVMLRFMKHEFHILLCTTIIETGIDVPSANTMFIDNADDFGLAQLYQLRGRIGRSKERAFAYLLIPAETDQLTPIARRRLEILHQFSELGAGFRIAQHDLELRGAGDLLGKNQHGHVAAVGYDLYAELLKEAVEEIRGRPHQDVPDPDINLPIAALIPDNYVIDLHERMSFYQRLATAESSADVYDVVGALSDQYGEPPTEVNALAEIMVLKQLLRQMTARLLEIGTPVEGTSRPRIVISLDEHSRLNPAKLASWVTSLQARALLTPKMKLIYTSTEQEWRDSNQQLLVLCKSTIKLVLENCL